MSEKKVYGIKQAARVKRKLKKQQREARAEKKRERRMGKLPLNAAFHWNEVPKPEYPYKCYTGDHMQQTVVLDQKHRWLLSVSPCIYNKYRAKVLINLCIARYGDGA